MEKHLFFLPGNTPEELIWSDELAKSQLNLLGITQNKIDECIDKINRTNNFKEKFKIYATYIHSTEVNSTQILSEQKRFVIAFANSESDNLTIIKELLTRIVNT